MIKLLFLFYAPGPTFLGFALAWLLKYPHDWTGPAVIIPVGLALIWWTQTAVTRWLQRKLSPSFAVALSASRIGGALMAPIIFLLMYFFLLE